ncbi:MAG: hypothetical protein ACI3ZN_08110 [Candidatus Cryptobacteroides sp.]
MKDFFNIKRFGNYLVTDIKSCLSKYWISMLIISMLGVIVCLFSGIISMLFGNGWDIPPFAVRQMILVLSLSVTAITVGSSCYGHITDKREGAAWLLVPASSFEKWLSMILISTILIPVVVAIVYICGDCLINLTDPDGGESVLAAGSRILGEIFEAEQDVMPESIKNALVILTNPLSWIDDFASISIMFTLGAIFFKKNKIAKTILCYIGASIVISTVSSPFMLSGLGSAIAADDPTSLFDSWIFNHLALIDTINDLTWLAAGLVLSYIRIRTIKH